MPGSKTKEVTIDGLIDIINDCKENEIISVDFGEYNE